MKRILLDTHALIWWLNGDNQLGANAIEHIANPENDIYVSAATVWEMSIKQQMGKLVVPEDIESKVEQAGFSELPITLFHGQQAGRLHLHHRDPFDRMLIAQAQAEGLQILTKDEQFPAYGIRLINASH
ncbi:type II toxin-antitoxin system VapC family toxin [uncultured Paraglaciecola sp.]|uniref:type II toxin-antitoxin system VapC family toxin n=1 Tax=uncultured Paraglaciecola sp. TaxID=1765024 RepID=UPI00261374A8|nr:type II toxin-antitoxin system VapC family toxin [uncultured Paraglaciecola sp.]